MFSDLYPRIQKIEAALQKFFTSTLQYLFDIRHDVVLSHKLYLSGDPQNDLEASTKHYVDYMAGHTSGNGSATSSTITIGSTTTLSPGTSATVANIGTASAAILTFGIPQGIIGLQGVSGTAGLTGASGTSGPAGASGSSGATGPAGASGATGPAGASGSTYMVWTQEEIPGGVLNSINTGFSLTRTPATGTFQLFINGIRQMVSMFTQSGTSLTINYAPQAGDLLACFYGVIGVGMATSAIAVIREVLGGTVDGVNTVFTLQFAPVSGTEMIFINGQLQQSGASADYTLSGTTATFSTPPPINSLLLCNYTR